MKDNNSLTSNATTLIDRPFEDYALLDSLKATITSTPTRNTHLDSLPSSFWGYLVYSPGTRFAEKRELRTRSRVQRVQEPFNLYLSKAHRFCTLAVKRGTNKIFIADSSTGDAVKQCTFVWDGSSPQSLGIRDETSGRTAVGGIFLEKGQVCPLQDGSIISFAKANGTAQDYVYHHAATKAPKSAEVLYETDTQAGAGATSRVKMARQKANGALYAVKRFKFYDMAISRHITREVIALSMLNHPGICELYEVYYGGSGRISELIIDYVTGNDLQTHLRKFSIDEPTARHISFQLCDTLAYIHSQFVIHGDIKPENILLVEYIPPKVKINDFGSAQVTTGGSARACGVTLGYAAPEALHPSVGQYTTISDIWSLGATIFYMLTKQHAYDDPDMGLTGTRKLNLPLNTKGFRHMSDEACDLLKKMLMEDPRQRISAASALQHAWLRNHRYEPPMSASTNAAYAYSDLTPTERCSPPPAPPLVQEKSASHPSSSVDADKINRIDFKCPICQQKFSAPRKNSNTSAQLKCIKCRQMEQKSLQKVRTEQRHYPKTTTGRKLKPSRTCSKLK